MARTIIRWDVCQMVCRTNGQRRGRPIQGKICCRKAGRNRIVLCIRNKKSAKKNYDSKSWETRQDTALCARILVAWSGCAVVRHSARRRGHLYRGADRTVREFLRMVPPPLALRRLQQESVAR